MSRLQQLRQHLRGDSSPDEMSAVDSVAEAGRDGLAGTVAIIIALATLIAAAAGYQQAQTSELADDRRLSATQLGLEAAASAQREQQRAHVEYQIYLRAVEQRTEAANAQLQSLFAGDGTPEQRAFELEQERWQALADASAEATEIKPDSEFGPLRDRSFPTRYFASAARDSHRLNALQDAYNEQANQLDGRAASYTAILAVLAVAVYLLGLTVAVRERLLRRAFLALGVVLMIVATGWTALTSAEPLAPIDAGAAEAYASARVELDTASDSAAHAHAKVLYDRAIELRPTYARAYLERASATIFAATPQRTGLISLVPAEALRSAQADLRRSLELGGTTASAYGRLGFYDFLEGVQTADPSALADSVAASRRAIELDPGEPVFHFNLAVALVALEEHGDAAIAYDAAVRHALYNAGDPASPRNEPQLSEQWLAGALSDLEVVDRHRPDLALQVQGYKESLVGRISAASLDMPLDAGVAATDVTLEVYPGRAQWQAALDGYDPASDVVSVQWYRAAPGTDELAVIPEISGSDSPYLGDDGRYGLQVGYLAVTTPPACLPAGTYTAELYVNGRLVATESVEPGFGELAAVAERDLTIAYCRPAEWAPVPEALPGLMRGHIAPAGDRGVYIMRIAMPRSFGEAEEISTLIIETAMGAFGSVFPGTPTYMEDEGTTADYFIGLQRTAWRWYDYGSGWVRAAAGLTHDGAAVVAMVYGPYAWFDEPEPFTILNSMVPYE